MPFINPLILRHDDAKHVLWSQILTKTEYYIEFIMMMQAKTEEYKNGAYIMNACQSLRDQKTDCGELKTGQFFYLDLAYRTFDRKWSTEDYVIRKAITPESNIKMKFVKLNQKSMKIINVEVTACTQEQRQFAENFYKSKDNSNER